MRPDNAGLAPSLLAKKEPKMKFDIKKHFTGDVLFTAEIEADENSSFCFRLGLAVKAALTSGANLSGAYLSGANLSRADLSGAMGIVTERITPLLMLKDQPGKIRAYKLVTDKGNGPYYPEINYEIGQDYSAEANIDETEHCGSGINVATLDWCLKEWCPGYRILIVEFEAADIAAIPIASDGKFRLHRCRVVAEKVIDPIALGLVKAPVAEVK